MSVYQSKYWLLALSLYLKYLVFYLKIKNKFKRQAIQGVAGEKWNSSGI
jgi:hypothetical protein